jgi:hypothetical protein
MIQLHEKWQELSSSKSSIYIYVCEAESICKHAYIKHAVISVWMHIHQIIAYKLISNKTILNSSWLHFSEQIYMQWASKC